MFSLSSFFRQRIGHRGFTLVELLVSVSIFAVITAIVLASHSRFNSTIKLVNLAHDVALTFRKAQTFGLNSRANQGIFENTGGVIGYGVRFRSDTPQEYLFYVDLNATNLVNSGELLERITLQNGYTVSKICINVIQGALGEHCSDTETIAFNAVYRRPNPEAVMRTNFGYADRGIVTVSAPNGNSREILVTASGQISVLTP